MRKMEFIRKHLTCKNKLSSKVLTSFHSIDAYSQGRALRSREIAALLILYMLVIHLPIFIAANNLILSTQVRTFKELFFGVWGYGWDGWHYLSIATTGYHFPNQAFFPLYPLIIRGLDFFLPLTLAYRVNLLLLPLLLICLSRLIRRIGLKNEIYALMTFLFFPTSFFLQANYAETIFILLSVLFFLGLFEKKDWWTISGAALATATKPQGVILVIIYLLKLLQDSKNNLRDLKTGLAILVKGTVASSGLLFYFAYLHLRFGTFQVFFEAQREWFRGGSNVLVNFWTTFTEAWRMLTIYVQNFPLIQRQILDLAVLAFFIGLLIWTRRKLRWELWLYSFLIILMPLLAGGTISLPRFALLAYPLLLVFGDTLKDKPLLLLSYFGLSITLQVLFILMFFNNAFVA